jgi:opacity protein-like surface antigen
MFNRLLLTIIALSSTLLSGDSFSSERFLGIEVGYGTVESRNLIDVSQSDKGVEFGFRIGAQNEEWRTTISGHQFNKNSQKYFRTMLQLDRFIWSSLYESDRIIFKPYLGGHVGWLKYTDGNIDDQGFVYGTQAGLAWNVIKEVDFDFGYRYSFSDVNKVNDIGSVVFAVNYLY